jgi:hypothetical protein
MANAFKQNQRSALKQAASNDVADSNESIRKIMASSRTLEALSDKLSIFKNVDENIEKWISDFLSHQHFGPPVKLTPESYLLEADANFASEINRVKTQAAEKIDIGEITEENGSVLPNLLRRVREKFLTKENFDEIKRRIKPKIDAYNEKFEEFKGIEEKKTTAEEKDAEYLKNLTDRTNLLNGINEDISNELNNLFSAARAEYLSYCDRKYDEVLGDLNEAEAWVQQEEARMQRNLQEAEARAQQEEAREQRNAPVSAEWSNYIHDYIRTCGATIPVAEFLGSPKAKGYNEKLERFEHGALTMDDAMELYSKLMLNWLNNNKSAFTHIEEFKHKLRKGTFDLSEAQVFSAEMLHEYLGKYNDALFYNTLKDTRYLGTDSNGNIIIVSLETFKNIGHEDLLKVGLRLLEYYKQSQQQGKPNSPPIPPPSPINGEGNGNPHTNVVQMPGRG